MVRKLRQVLLVLLFGLLAHAAHAATLNVGPGQPYTTIQSAINAAANGDTVLVAPGTYYENLNFNSKAITLLSLSGSASTILDGSHNGATVILGTAASTVPPVAGQASVLDGFTVQNSFDSNPYNVFTLVAGVSVQGNAIVQNNTITANLPSGINVQAGSTIIRNNRILANQINNATYGGPTGGTGIYIAPNTTVGGFSLTVTNNDLEQNQGNALNLFYGLGATSGDQVYPYTFRITNNTFRGNSPGGTSAAIGIFVYGGTYLVSGNLIAATGGPAISSELHQSVYAPQSTAAFINNTLVNNGVVPTYQGSEVDFFGIPSTFSNNLVVHQAASTAPTFFCGPIPSGTTPLVFDHNDLYSPLAPPTSPGFGVSGNCPFTGSLNRSEDPLFRAAGDYHLNAASGEIDSGNNAAPFAPTTDLDGTPRPFSANGSVPAIIDIGAYEYIGNAPLNVVTETLQSSANPSVSGALVTFNTHFAASAGVPAGTVLFSDTGTPLSVQALDSAGNASFSTDALSLGNHIITAAYQPTGTFTATSASLTQVVTQPGTTTAVTCNPSTIFLNGSSQILASVATSTGALAAGTVSFADNGTALGQSPLVNGNALYTYSDTTLGTHIITATTTPAGNFSGSSASCTLTVPARPTALALTSSQSPASVGRPVTFTANVTYQNQGSTVAGGGTVTFYDGTTPLQTVTVTSTAAASAAASFTTSALAAGTHSITATLTPPQAYAASTASISQQIIALQSVVTLTTPNLNLALGAPIVLTAVVAPATPPGAGVPTGTVVFFLDGVQIALPAVAANGSVTVTAPGFRIAGLHVVTCAYSGDNFYTGAVCAPLALTVAVAPTTTTLIAGPLTAFPGQTVTLSTITVSGVARATGGVTFYDGAQPLGTSPSANNQSTLATTTLAVGRHVLTATYLGDANTAASTSNPFYVTIVANTSSTSLAVSPNPAYQGQVVTLLATVATSATQPLSASVAFRDGTQLLGTVAVSNQQASFTTTSFAAGTHALTATYLGDASTPGSTSPTVQEVVLSSDFNLVANPTTLSLTTGHHTTFTLTAQSSGAFSGPLQLAFDPGPAHTTLRPRTNTLTLAPGASAGTSIYLDTDDVIGYLSTSPAPQSPFRNPRNYTPLAALLALACFGRRRRLPALLAVLCAALALSAATGCSGKYPASTAPGNYTLRVTATSPTQTHTLQIPLTVTE